MIKSHDSYLGHNSQHDLKGLNFDFLREMWTSMFINQLVNIPM